MDALWVYFYFLGINHVSFRLKNYIVSLVIINNMVKIIISIFRNVNIYGLIFEHVLNLYEEHLNLLFYYYFWLCYNVSYLFLLYSNLINSNVDLQMCLRFWFVFGVGWCFFVGNICCSTQKH